MKRHILAAAIIFFFMLNANAELKPRTPPVDDTDATSLCDFLNRSYFDGRLRGYFFSRNFGRQGVPNQNAFSFGGWLNMLTARVFTGFQIGATAYTAQPLGLTPGKHIHIDKSLPGFPVTALGQAYLQYSHATYLIRGGYQIIESPWLGPSDTRMIPATYEAILASYFPIEHLKLTGFRQFKFKSRTNDYFNNTNLYNTRNFGGFIIVNDQHPTAIGTLAFGASYDTNLKLETWYYKFYDYANMLYGSLNYTFLQQACIKPLLGVQALREWGDGDNKLAPFEYGAANATAFGMLVGLDSKMLTLKLGYNNIPTRSGFNHGNILSPYTAGYITDPLYTTSMISGLIEKGSGYAFKLSAILHLLDNNLQILGSYARYYTNPRFANTNEVDTDFIYTPPSIKNLELRYRLGVENGRIATGRFLYSRVMINYLF